ncbi:hypothetical protein AKJ45_02070 [candidate division MSBL1 archaeon SCGC-AAA261F19]|uniref:Uncharacterized protein n=1 Tax=candidate division MSBL1 archaeon SCGC-AAA261F19 TaxID=1698275 RepID=A0A133V9W5_9EURY|nr:hypothetical protein AKJ45_02070 [candidate division MSBL1 archaeon SCGC-AAA261F19]
MVKARRKTLIKYVPKGVNPSFWQELYGYSKGEYKYPGLLDEIPEAERLAKTLIAVPEGEAEKVKDFLRKHGAEFEERGLMTSASRGRGERLRWDSPDRVLQEGLEGLGEEMDKLGSVIGSETRRNALKDVEMYGY